MSSMVKQTNFGARGGERIRGNLFRGETGRFQGGPGAQLRARLEALRERRTTRGRRRAQSDEERTQRQAERAEERDLERQVNRQEVLAQLNIAPDGQDALSALRDGQQPDPDALARAGLVEAGLVTQSEAGEFRLTPAGRRLLTAADQGDVGLAGDRISEARDRVARREQREQAREQRRVEREAARQARGGGGRRQPANDDEPATTRTPQLRRGSRGSGGTGPRIGGGGSRGTGGAPRQPSPREADSDDAPDRETQRQEARAANMQSVTTELGFSETALAGLSKLVAGENAPEAEVDGLIDQGLASFSPDLDAFVLTPTGRTFANAAQRGDLAGARSALARASERARTTREREQTRQQERQDQQTSAVQKMNAGERLTDREIQILEEDGLVDRVDGGIRLNARGRRLLDAQGTKVAFMDDDLLEEWIEALADEVTELEDALDDADDNSAIKAPDTAAGRRALNDRDFVIPENRSFPVTEPGDVPNAVSSWGRANPPSGVTFEVFKERLIKLAKRKGEAFVSALPEAWKEDMDGQPSRAVKSLGDDRIGGYTVLFGTSATPDISSMRDFFTKQTDFWLDVLPEQRPMLYHHAMESATADDPVVGMWQSVKVDDIGVWLKGELNKRHKYYTAVKELVDRQALALSSDSAPHLVRRARQRNGTHEVTRWPLLMSSLTPTPAEPRLLPVAQIKTAYKAIGLDVDIEDDTPDPAKGETILSSQSANDTDVRRELELITIDQEVTRAQWTKFLDC